MRSKNNLLIALLIIVLPLVSSGQTNYSGKWLYDKSKSAQVGVKSTYDGAVLMTIVQDNAKFSLSELWTGKGGDTFQTATEVYQLNGKEEVKKSEVGTKRKTAQWSSDKKNLTITVIDTQDLRGKPADFIVKMTYILSPDGKTLTVEEYSKNQVTGEKTVKYIYQKK